MVPVGFDGVATSTPAVSSSHAADTRSAVSCHAVSASTATARAAEPSTRRKWRLHGYPGSASSTSSPGSTVAASARSSAPDAPVVTTTRSGATSTPRRSPYIAAIASRSGGMPSAEV